MVGVRVLAVLRLAVERVTVDDEAVTVVVGRVVVLDGVEGVTGTVAGLVIPEHPATL